MSDSALVLFSGGQDSTVCLAWALDRYDRVETIGFDYGQRHIVELDCRKRVLQIFKNNFPDWGSRLGSDHFLKLSALSQISETSLTREVEIKISNEGLPSTFVPGRNLLFFTYAAAVAYRRNIRTLVGGMCETDFSGYPDCRNETLQLLAKVIGLGTDETFTIETPLMWLNKAQTWALANDLGGSDLVDMIIEETHSCYLGDRTRHHDWGFGCGACPACELRAAGFAAWKKMVPDPCH